MTSVLDNPRSLPVTHPAVADPRVAFTRTAGLPGVLDGGWWPRTSTLAQELPALLACVASRFGVVARVSLSATIWDATPQQITTGDRVVEVAWYRAADAHSIKLLGEQSWNLNLLVIPPDTPPDTAAAALALVARRHTVAALHIILSTPPPPTPPAPPTSSVGPADPPSPAQPQRTEQVGLVRRPAGAHLRRRDHRPVTPRGQSPVNRWGSGLAVRRRTSRPSPLRWLWYLLGGRRPDAQREWALHEVG